MNPHTTTETTYRAVILHGENGEFGRSMSAPRATIEEAKMDAIRLNGSDFDRPTDKVVVEQTVVVTTTTVVV